MLPTYPPYYPSYKYSVTGPQSISCRSLSTCNLNGGTAKGSRSTQQFTYGNIGTLELETTTIRIRLIPSESRNMTVQKTNKVFCIHCGTKNPRKANFCHQCGNKIEK